MLFSSNRYISRSTTCCVRVLEQAHKLCTGTATASSPLHTGTGRTSCGKKIIVDWQRRPGATNSSRRRGPTESLAVAGGPGPTGTASGKGRGSIHTHTNAGYKGNELPLHRLYPGHCQSRSRCQCSGTGSLACSARPGGLVLVLLVVVLV